MSRLDVQFLDESFHRALFDSIPMPVFVVDRDVSILDYNSAAARIIGEGRREILGRRGGDVLQHPCSTERLRKLCDLQALHRTPIRARCIPRTACGPQMGIVR